MSDEITMSNDESVENIPICGTETDVKSDGRPPASYQVEGEGSEPEDADDGTADEEDVEHDEGDYDVAEGYDADDGEDTGWESEPVDDEAGDEGGDEEEPENDEDEEDADYEAEDGHIEDEEVHEDEVEQGEVADDEAVFGGGAENGVAGSADGGGRDTPEVLIRTPFYCKTEERTTSPMVCIRCDKRTRCAIKEAGLKRIGLTEDQVWRTYQAHHRVQHTEPEYLVVPTESVEPGSHFRIEMGSLASLEKSISTGIWEPLLVEETGQGRYRLINGHRRLAAAKNIRLTNVPVLVVSLTGLLAEKAGIETNIERKSYTRAEEARAMLRLKEVIDLLGHKESNADGGAAKSTVVQISETTGKPTRVVERRMFLAKKLSPKAMAAWDGRRITQEAGEALAGVDHETQDTIIETASGGGTRAIQAEVVKHTQKTMGRESVKAVDQDATPGAKAVSLNGAATGDVEAKCGDAIEAFDLAARSLRSALEVLDDTYDVAMLAVLRDDLVDLVGQLSDFLIRRSLPTDIAASDDTPAE